VGPDRSNRAFGWGLLTSVAVHAALAAAVASMPPVNHGSAAWSSLETSAPMMLIPLEPTPPKPVPPPEPKPKPVEPERPPEPEAVRLGMEGSQTPTSPTWLRSEAEGEHAARQSTVEQPALTKQPAEPPPAPPASPSAEPAAPQPAAMPAQAKPAVEPVPAAPTPRPEPVPASALPAAESREQPRMPEPEAVPSPVDEPPPPPPAASAPVPPAVPPVGVSKDEIKPRPTEPPMDAPSVPKPVPGAKPPENETKPGQQRDGPQESPTPPTDAPVPPARDEVGPPDALLQRPPAEAPAPPVVPTNPVPPAEEPLPEITPEDLAPARPANRGNRAAPRPSGRGTEAMDMQAWLTDREADASSIRRAAVYRNGRVDAGEGLDIRTVRPRFSTFALSFATPRPAMLEISFDRTGVVREAKVLRSSGFPMDVDEPIRNAVFNWRATGRLLRELPDRPNARVTLRIEFILG
jgi:hypothetical protein